MRRIAVLGLITSLTGAGCASTDTFKGGPERDFSGFTRRANPSLRVGEPRVTNSSISDARDRLSFRRSDSAGSRLVFGDGRFTVCWTRRSSDGRRALAQAFKADGIPLGGPVVISPPAVDVVGIPEAIATDEQHIFATFQAKSENSLNEFAVPIDVYTPDGDTGRGTAKRSLQ